MRITTFAFHTIQPKHLQIAIVLQTKFASGAKKISLEKTNMVVCKDWQNLFFLRILTHFRS